MEGGGVCNPGGEFEGVVFVLVEGVAKSEGEGSVGAYVGLIRREGLEFCVDGVED